MEPTPTPTPDPEPLAPILLDQCVMDNGDGTFTARFSYTNLNAFLLEVPVGAENYFTYGPTPGSDYLDLGQPEQFLPDAGDGAKSAKIILQIRSQIHFLLYSAVAS